MANSVPSRGWPGFAAALTLILIAGVAFHGIHLSKGSNAAGEHMKLIKELRRFPGQTPRLRESYTGLAAIDEVLSILVIAFISGVAGWDRGCQIQQFYFLLSFSAVMAVLLVETGRGRSSGRACAYSSIYAILYQTAGGGFIIPLIYLAHMNDLSWKDHVPPSSRQVPTAYTRALLPSWVIGYVLPTIFLYYPSSDPNLYFTQGMIAFWQVTPLLTSILLYILSKIYETDTSAGQKGAFAATKRLRNLDQLYLVSFIVASVTHVGVVIACLLSKDPQMSLVRSLVLVSFGSKPTPTEGIHFIFQVDYWTISAAAMLGSFVMLWDVKRASLTTLSLTRAALGLILGATTVGPFATVAAVAGLRERMLARKTKE